MTRGPMRRVLILGWAMLAGCPAPHSQAVSDPEPLALPRAAEDEPLTRIAVGSCLHQDNDMAILETIRRAEPDLFLMIGDNVYADATSPDELQAAFDKLADAPEFAALRAEVPIEAVWDDHDFGLNDAGQENPIKAQAQALTLDFFGVDPNSPRRQREGIYDAIALGPQGQRVQIILLDTRYFRDALVPSPAAGRKYAPNPDPEATVLGEAQWLWLEQVLAEPAELRILVSSIQLVSSEHGWEGWGLFPHERERLFEMLHASGEGNLMVVSGDRHRGELSCARYNDKAHAVYDLTSSSLNRLGKGSEHNRFRVGDTLVAQTHFALIDIDWPHHAVTLSLRDKAGATVLVHRLRLAPLRAADEACPRL